MHKKYLLAAVIASLFGHCYGQAVTADFAAMYVTQADSVVFSAISFAPCEQISVTRYDANVTADGDSFHYALTDYAFSDSYFAFRFLWLDVPPIEDNLTIDSLSLPITMAELRFPFERTAFRAGIVQGVFPWVKGSLEGQGVSFRHGELRGWYAGFSHDDLSCVAYWGVLTGDAYASLIHLGSASARGGLAVARWKRLGLFCAAVDGDASLVGGTLISFFTGHQFSVEGNLSARALGLWFGADRSFGPVIAGFSGLAGFVWSSDTGLSYRDKWKESGVRLEETTNAGVDFSPAGIVLICPSLTWRVNQSLDVRASRFIPVAWGWDIERFGDGNADSGTSGAGDSRDGLSAETLLLSGLTVSVSFAFR